MQYKIFDAHCDTLGKLFNKGETLSKNSGMVRSDMLRSYGGFVQVFAAWVSKKNPMGEALAMAELFHKEMKENGFRVILHSKDLENVVQSGDVGAILALEDGAALDGSIRMLHEFYTRGFRLITLTWNGQNALGDGAVDSAGRGLTPFGKEVVREMESLGMVIDVSHLSERGFWDVSELAKKPFIASHSNAKAVCNHPRNLSDAQICALIKQKGVVGINLYPLFLHESGKADITDVLRHTEHILSLGGEENIGIGTDFDGIDCQPMGLENTAMLYKILEEMQKIGYNDCLIMKMAYKNFQRIFKACL